MNITPETLNDLMEFDHVIRVNDDGSVSEPRNVYAPSLYEDGLDTPGWSLMNGYSGQDRYSGPLMHQSEYVGGGMARDILATSGDYVVVANYTDDEDGPTEWAVAFRPLEVSIMETDQDEVTP